MDARTASTAAERGEEFFLSLSLSSLFRVSFLSLLAWEKEEEEEEELGGKEDENEHAQSGAQKAERFDIEIPSF